MERLFDDLFHLFRLVPALSALLAVQALECLLPSLVSPDCSLLTTKSLNTSPTSLTSGVLLLLFAFMAVSVFATGFLFFPSALLPDFLIIFTTEIELTIHKKAK